MLPPVIAVIATPPLLEPAERIFAPVRNDRVPPDLLVCDRLEIHEIGRLPKLLVYLLAILDTIQKAGTSFKA